MKKEKAELTTEQKKKVCDEKSMNIIKDTLRKKGCYEENKTA